METKRRKLRSIRSERNTRFDKREIQRIVERIESGVPRRDILKEYGMHESTLTNWMNRYGSEHYQQERNRRYSPSEKRTVLRAVESGMSVREVCVAFGIKCRTVVDKWVRQQKAENVELSVEIPQMKKKEKKKQENVAADTQSLEEQLAYAQLKIQALETLIDIAEEKLNVDIRKKSGARQSPK